MWGIIGIIGRAPVASLLVGARHAGGIAQQHQLGAARLRPLEVRYRLFEGLAYHTAVAKGTDVDQPRNLA